jgi:hypothetical protein
MSDCHAKAVNDALRRCVHLTCYLDSECKAGVRYDDVREPLRGEGDTRPPYLRMPCTRGGPETCRQCRFPTQEEAEEQVAATDRMIDNTLRAMVAVTAVVGKQRGVSGSIPCPICETGTLSYAVAGLNGHIHGACSTEGCVRWKQ